MNQSAGIQSASCVHKASNFQEVQVARRAEAVDHEAKAEMLGDAVEHVIGPSSGLTFRKW